MDNDSPDVTSSGRSFQVRASTTGKARLVSDGVLTCIRQKLTPIYDIKILIIVNFINWR